MSLTLRNQKGSRLTHTELDNNFLYLKELIQENVPESTPVLSSDLSWNDVNLIPGVPISSVRNGSWINLNLNVNPDLWTSQVRFSGIDVEDSFLVDGAFGSLRNVSDLPIRLQHLNAEAKVGLNMSVKKDFVLEPNGIVQMVYSKSSNQLNVYVNEVAVVRGLFPQSEVFRIEKEHLETEKVVFELKNIPSENEFLFTFCNGVLLNPDGINVSDNFIVIDKKTIEYEFKVGMKITVNYKY